MRQTVFRSPNICRHLHQKGATLQLPGRALVIRVSAPVDYAGTPADERVAQVLPEQKKHSGALALFFPFSRASPICMRYPADSDFSNICFNNFESSCNAQRLAYTPDANNDTLHKRLDPDFPQR